jgi:UDP-N-acetylglucosamine 2-epimerase (non-hydrolysing)
MKLFLIAGARPNFMKIAPLMHALEGNKNIEVLLIHTGQHYDLSMSEQIH